MRVIHKFKLSADTLQTLELPKYSTVLSVKNQYEQIVLYASIDLNEMSTEEIEIMILGTGQRTSTGKMYKFLDTVILAGGDLVFHVLYRAVDRKSELRRGKI